MAERKTAKAGTSTSGFTAEERAAMKAHAQELKAAERREEGESLLLAAIAAMPGPDRTLAEKLHAVIKDTAPMLEPKTWYGMPAYARDGKVICFFQSADKFKTRYATFGFQHDAHLDEGAMWPVSFALTELNGEEEARIRALVTKAVS